MLVDGQPQTGPLVVEKNADRSYAISVSAPGFMTHNEELIADDSREITIALEPIEKAPVAKPAVRPASSVRRPPAKRKPTLIRGDDL